MPFHEIMPGSFATLWTEIESVFLQDSRDSGAGDLDPQFFKFAEDLAIAPAGILRHLYNQTADFLGFTRTTRLARFLFRLFAIHRVAAGRLPGL